MARIRSVHPGLYTDEAFVSVSMAARVLLPGLWTECDDQGVFEWKPLSLKMKIFPADPVDVAALLDELEAAGIVKRFAVENRGYGAVRNFRKYQRPKKPANKHPLPDEWRSFVGLTCVSSEPVRNQFGTGTEKSQQMEDGGGRRERRRKEEKKKDTPSLRSGASAEREIEREFEDWYAGYPHKVGRAQALKAYRGARRKGATPEDLRDGRDRYIAAKPPDISWCNPATFLNGERWKDQPAQGYSNGQRAFSHRSDTASGPSQTHADAVLAGMARVAARRFGGEPPDRSGDGPVPGHGDAAASDAAKRGPAAENRGSSGQLALVAAPDTG